MGKGVVSAGRVTDRNSYEVVRSPANPPVNSERHSLENWQRYGVHEVELDLRHRRTISIHHLHWTGTHLLLEITLREELSVDVLLNQSKA